ncbi:MAG: hypothetical protein PHC66_02545 [Candidatus Nanoarchaeia archaeon]|nr:hypothetical protein [Candidatus Nanoarchaeia archaeon]MDD5239696.1 hypothetical protein [Candidatus Nanoarchaeia archaeon]
MANGEALAENVRYDLIEVLEQVKDALERMDIDALSEWSNHTIHSIAIYREKRAVYIAIIAYSLSKLVEKKREHLVEKDKWSNFIANLLKEMVQAVEALESKNIGKFDALITQMMKQISDFDVSFSRYAQEVLEFSKVQKGARIYEHGISLSGIAEMLGVSKWDLMRKVGELKEKPEEEHVFGVTKSSKQRLEELKKLSKK